MLLTLLSFVKDFTDSITLTTSVSPQLLDVSVMTSLHFHLSTNLACRMMLHTFFITLIFQESGVWMPEFSDDICIPVSCGIPESPEHGFVVGTKFNYKDVVLYKCDSGYKLQVSKLIPWHSKLLVVFSCSYVMTENILCLLCISAYPWLLQKFSICFYYCI